MDKNITFTINNEEKSLLVKTHWTLLRVIRDELRLTGTKEGCGEGECGSCTVLVNGEAVNSCLMLAVDVDGKSVETIEGLARDGKLHPLQKSFVEKGAIQCGFCTPGMIMASKALLEENPTLSEDELRYRMAGNLCRCTGYTKIVEAIMDVAEHSEGESRE
jgi:carbon-monoxide dehydrogenase small subunit